MERSGLSELATEPAWEIVQWQPSAAQFPEGGPWRRWRIAPRMVCASWSVPTPTGSCAEIVSHGDIIKAIVADALGVHLDHFQRIVIDTAR